MPTKVQSAASAVTAMKHNKSASSSSITYITYLFTSFRFFSRMITLAISMPLTGKSGPKRIQNGYNRKNCPKVSGEKDSGYKKHNNGGNAN